MRVFKITDKKSVYYMDFGEGDELFANGKLYICNNGELKEPGPKWTPSPEDVTPAEELMRKLKDSEKSRKETRNLPAHYDIPGLPEPLMNIIFTIADYNTEDKHEHFYLCNALKYLARYGHKNGTDDLSKAIDYIERIKELNEGGK